jgi:hypothetical protein
MSFQTLTFYSKAVSTTAVAVSAAPADLYGWTIINPHSAAIYVKIYNIAAASVNPASDVPHRILYLAANSMIHTDPICIQEGFTTAISVRVTTDLADTGTTAAATLPLMYLKYYKR